MQRTSACLAALWGVLCLAGPAAAQSLGTIDSVTIIPPAPTDADPITVQVDGTASSGPVTILGSDVTREGNHLDLVVRLDLGNLTVLTPWSHTHEIGLLPPGSYSLTATALAEGQSAGTRQVSFTVVPEPAALPLLAVAGLMLARRRLAPRP